MYYIHNITTYANANKKGIMLCEYLKTFDKTIFPNEIDFDAFYNEVHLYVCKLNEKFARSKDIIVQKHDCSIYFKIKDQLDKYAAIIHFSKVNGFYRFSDKSDVQHLHSADMDLSLSKMVRQNIVLDIREEDNRMKAYIKKIIFNCNAVDFTRLNLMLTELENLLTEIKVEE